MGHPGCRGSSGDERVALARAEVRRSLAPAKELKFTSNRWCLPLRPPKLQRFNSREPGSGSLARLSPFEETGVRESERGARFRRPRTFQTGCAVERRKPRAALLDRHHRTPRRFYDACRSSG